MLNFVRGILLLLAMTLNTLILIGPLMLVTLVKLILPSFRLKRRCAVMAMQIAEIWCAVNIFLVNRLLTTRWRVQGDYSLRRDTSYLVLPNHQSGADIPALVWALNGRVPYYKFFMKRTLVWIPVIGQACWALEYPLMHRYSKEFLQKHPEKQGKDLEITKRACEKCRGMPITVINFPEGTRFSPEKHARQKSPYRNLLKPKAGGISFVLASIGDQIDTIKDVTIVYPGGVPGFVDFLFNRIPEVIIDIRQYPLDQHWVRGDYRDDPEFRQAFQDWINQIWREKDQRIDRIRAQLSSPNRESDSGSG